MADEKDGAAADQARVSSRNDIYRSDQCAHTMLVRGEKEPVSITGSSFLMAPSSLVRASVVLQLE